METPAENGKARLGSRYTEALSSNTRRGSIYWKMTILSGSKKWHRTVYAPCSEESAANRDQDRQ
jgi:hypothetical protein